MEHGIITSVNYESGAVVCNVRAIRRRTHYTNVPMMKTHSGVIQVPKQGQTVTMNKLSDGTRFISEVISKEEAAPDSMSEGEVAVQLDGDTRLYFTENGSGGYDVDFSASGALNLSATGDINLSADGDVNLDSTGKVYINGTAFGDHTHAYTDDEISDTSDGSGSETTQNKTTDTPQ